MSSIGLVSGRISILALLIIIGITLYVLGKTVQSGKTKIKVRELPAVAAISEGIGRAVEMGRPVLWSTGDKGQLTGELAPQVILQFEILRTIARLCCTLGARLICCVGGEAGNASEQLPLVEAIVNEQYAAAGKAEQARGIVQFIASDQAAYTAGLMSIIMRENVGCNIMIGPWGTPCIVVGETGNRVGAYQIGASARGMDAYFVALFDYNMIGEDSFAAGALLSKEPVFLAQCLISDLLKFGMMTVAVISIIGGIFYGSTLLKTILTY
jgi:hypothetical protein